MASSRSSWPGARHPNSAPSERANPVGSPLSVRPAIPQRDAEFSLPAPRSGCNAFQPAATAAALVASENRPLVMLLTIWRNSARVSGPSTRKRIVHRLPTVSTDFLTLKRLARSRKWLTAASISHRLSLCPARSSITELNSAPEWLAVRLHCSRKMWRSFQKRMLPTRLTDTDRQPARCS